MLEWSDKCAQCGHPAQPHAFRHRFVPCDSNSLPYDDRIKLVRKMVAALRDGKQLEGLIVEDLPGADETVEKWVRWMELNLLPLVHSGRDTKVWGTEGGPELGLF